MNKIMNVLELPLLPAPDPVLLIPEYSVTFMELMTKIETYNSTWGEYPDFICRRG